MKTSLKYFACFLLLTAFGACQEEEVPLYGEERNRLNFILQYDPVTRYTFVYEPQEKREDTVWIEVATVGYVTDYPRGVSLCQLESDTLQAVPGVHYVAFDDPRLASSHVIPAGAAGALLPLIVKRDASLSEAEYSLNIGIVENEHFTTGFPDAVEKQVTIADILTKPTNWDRTMDILFSPYGTVKHRFMIDAAAPLGIIINEDFISSCFSPLDFSLITYYKQYFKLKLAEENEARDARGLGPLREAPIAGQAEGTLVTF
jgi:hypothetical protein